MTDQQAIITILILKGKCKHVTKHPSFSVWKKMGSFAAKHHRPVQEGATLRPYTPGRILRAIFADV